jgi:hypothetical protein
MHAAEDSGAPYIACGFGVFVENFAGWRFQTGYPGPVRDPGNYFHPL